MKEMEAEISGLQREKEELNSALLCAKASANSSKSVDAHCIVSMILLSDVDHDKPLLHSIDDTDCVIR